MRIIVDKAGWDVFMAHAESAAYASLCGGQPSARSPALRWSSHWMVTFGSLNWQGTRLAEAVTAVSAGPPPGPPLRLP